MKKWYVISVKRKMENVAEDNLKNQGFLTYSPCYLEERIHRGEKMNVLVPIFPGYMFVAFDVERDRWRAVGSTKGVYQLLTYRDDRVTALPQGFVEELMQKEGKDGYVTLPDADKTVREYVIGEELQIKDGVFVGFTGVCQKIKKDRITLLLSLLSGKVSVELPKQALSHLSLSDAVVR